MVKRKKNSGKKKSPVKKYLDFTGKDTAKITTDRVNIPDTYIFIGDVINLDYVSDKWDGKKRAYTHKLKKHGKMLVSPNGKTVLITGLNLNVTGRGLSG
ncbi:MAG: hypothetical protein EHM58_04495 [Ignavibacteriae bacterium]|nr:MAG: hypothetical protein EHM58_04495 [Ignavibacteriota bacterium]